MKTLFLLLVSLSVFDTASADWKNYLSVDNQKGVKEGFAFTEWTSLSATVNWPDDKIDAALVASCDDKGDRSLYLRILTQYPFGRIARSNSLRGAFVEGQIQWDSSSAYNVPFSYDTALNALRLQSGLEDSFSLIGEGNKVTIQIPWNSGQQAVFEFSLRGSLKALRTAFDFCRGVSGAGIVQ